METTVVRLKYTQFMGNKWRWVPPHWARPLGAVMETVCLHEAPYCHKGQICAGGARKSAALTEYFLQAKAELRDPTTGAKTGTVAWLIHQFEKSTWYKNLRQSTRTKEVDLCLKTIREARGSTPVSKMSRKIGRQLHEDVTEAVSQDKANRVIKWLTRLMYFAVETGVRTDNPIAKMELKHNKPRRQRWTVREVVSFIRAAQRMGYPSMALAVRLAYDTSQRLDDLLTAKWDCYKRDHLDIVQSKTGEEVFPALSISTRRILDSMAKTGVQILIYEETHQPYSAKTFNRVFNRIKVEAGIRAELQFRDLRRTAITEVRAAGGAFEHMSGHVQGSRMARIYDVPNLEAAKQALKSRNRKATK